MLCPNGSKHEVIENQALGKRFYYCRCCKKEVELEARAVQTPMEAAIRAVENRSNDWLFETMIVPFNSFNFIRENGRVVYK